MTTIRRRLDSFSLVRPHIGFPDGGDAAVIREHDGALLVAVIDALGHGPAAHEVAIQAVRYLRTGPAAEGPVMLLEGLHAVLEGTRGAGAGIGILDIATGVLRYAGVGNTVVRRFGDGHERLVSVEGILGANIRSPREQQMVLRSGDVLVMYTDGVRDRFELRDYPQLPGQDAEAIARTVIARFGKDHDDATCLAVRYDP